MDESCGKCVPCRAGTVQIYRLLTKVTEGRATEADITLLRSLCDLVQNTSLCGLGQSAPNPVLSTLRFFPEEYAGKLTKGPVLHIPVSASERPPDGLRPSSPLDKVDGGLLNGK
jgi:hypothetical protein